MSPESGDLVSRLYFRCLSAVSSGAALLVLSGAPASAASPPHTLLKPLLVPTQARSIPADFQASDVSGSAGRPIPIKIDVFGNNTEGLFIFTGIPEGVELKPGGNLGNFWAVNADVIKDLTLTAPPNFSGSFTVKISRSPNQASQMQPVTMTVTIADRTSPAAMPTAATPNLPQMPRPTAPSAHLPNEAMLMARAKESFGKGDVSGARVIYEYLATQGSAAAAMAMGETYDPIALKKLVIKGLEADAKKAQLWYEKAEQLGSGEARSRLNALAAR